MVELTVLLFENASQRQRTKHMFLFAALYYEILELTVRNFALKIIGNTLCMIHRSYF